MYESESNFYALNLPTEKHASIDPPLQSIDPPSQSIDPPLQSIDPPSPKPQVQIDFKTMFPVLVKTDTQTLTFMWNNDTSIEKMFIVTSEAFSRHADSFYLIFGGKKLHSSSATLKEMNIASNAVIHCVFKMRGGMLTESSGRAGGYKLL